MIPKEVFMSELTIKMLEKLILLYRLGFQMGQDFLIPLDKGIYVP